MAFQEIEKTGFGMPRKVATVSVKAVTDHAIQVRISGDIYASIGSPSFIKVMVGSGKHSGFIALVPRNMPMNAYTVHQSGPKARQRYITLSPKRIGVSADKSATHDLPHEITEDGLVIDIRPLRKPALVAAE